MKCGKILYGAVCFMLGAALFGGGAAYAGVMAEQSRNTVYVDGQKVELDAYLINDNNYVKLRDVGQLVGFNVYWNGTVQIQSDAPYTGEAPAISTPAQKPEESKPEEKTAQIMDEQTVEEELIQLINDYRKENGLESFVKSEVLMECADIRVQEIKVKFAHTRPDGRDSSTVVKDVTGLNYGCMENCAKGCYSASQVFNGWKNSPGHNNLMLSEDDITIGIGYSESGGFCAMETSVRNLDTLYHK